MDEALLAALGILVIDDLLPDPDAYRQAVLAASYEDVNVGHAVFHGIGFLPQDVSAPLVAALTAIGIEPTVTMARQSPHGQDEPNFIHTDTDMGEVTAIFYLTPTPAEGDGTTFWRHQSGCIASEAPDDETRVQEALEWRQRAHWTPWVTIPARFNRLLIFPAPLFHSRALEANYGAVADGTARLIQLVFGRATTEGGAQ